MSEKYIPSKEEFLERFPGSQNKFNIDDDTVRANIWAKPDTIQLTPFKAGMKDTSLQSAGGKARALVMKERADRKKNKDFILGLIREEIAGTKVKISPRAVIDLTIDALLADGELEAAAEMSLKVLEFDEGKKQRVEQETTVRELGKATPQDAEDFVNDVISLEEFRRKQKGE